MKKIDDTTTVPFSWLITALVFCCGGAWSTAYFVFGVKMDINDLKKDVKLLKAKAGIPEDEARSGPAIIQDAEASK
jgi:hypothetical protein